MAAGNLRSRYRRGHAQIDPHSKVGDLALLLVRVFQSLDPLVGGNDAQCKGWMRSRNTTLGDEPAKRVLKPDSLTETLAYLDGMRATA